MQEVFHRIWTNIVERTEGPMHFRFLMQPTMSLIFAIAAAIRDARSGTSPYISRLVLKKDQRSTTLRELWKDVGKVFIFGIVLDIVYQLVVIFSKETKEHFYPLESILVAFGLAFIPYLLFRGPLNRLFSLFIREKQGGPSENKS